MEEKNECSGLPNKVQLLTYVYRSLMIHDSFATAGHEVGACIHSG